jgi:uncharacterized protein YyaL (SSP411 family)
VFHRYSVDGLWRVPHFEKMLYDQAQLTGAYLDAYQITGDLRYEAIARDTLDYVRRDLTDAGGGFYSAEDADSLTKAGGSEKAEGAFYVGRRRKSMRRWASMPNFSIITMASRRAGTRPKGAIHRGNFGARTFSTNGRASPKRRNISGEASSMSMSRCVTAGRRFWSCGRNGRGLISTTRSLRRGTG